MLTKDQRGLCSLVSVSPMEATNERRQRSETNESPSRGTRSSSSSSNWSSHIYYSLPSSFVAMFAQASFTLCVLSTSSFFLLDKWHANIVASITRNIPSCCLNILNEVGSIESFSFLYITTCLSLYFLWKVCFRKEERTMIFISMSSSSSSFFYIHPYHFI
jgi:hypothetical protein